jgi:anionic cell wall polymer biosynthesis LytR-Cps2A-Psr (LCP) family protein
MAIIDYVGFRDLTTAIDGVDVFIPEAITDPQQHVDWPQGWNHVEGNLALNYVRMRYGLENGDFDRIARQQNFMRAMMEKVLADETVGNPAKFTDTLAAITDNLTVDESWGNGQIRGLALGLRGLSSDKVRFVTLPLDHYERLPEDGYVNMIDAERVRELFDAFDDDALAAYLRKHPEDELPEPDEVS